MLKRRNEIKNKTNLNIFGVENLTLLNSIRIELYKVKKDIINF